MANEGKSVVCISKPFSQVKNINPKEGHTLLSIELDEISSSEHTHETIIYIKKHSPFQSLFSQV